MKKYCPLSVGRPYNDGKCSEEYCMFTDEAGECLIKQALQCYVSESRTRQAKSNEFSCNYIGEFINLCDR